MSRILIADDTQIYREALATAFRVRGYHVICASSGREALAAVAASRPDVILLDLMMPGTDGFEVLRVLKEESCAGVPVIVLSASSDERHVQRARELGAADVMLKSRFSTAELVRRVEGLVKQAKAA